MIMPGFLSITLSWIFYFTILIFYFTAKSMANDQFFISFITPRDNLRSFYKNEDKSLRKGKPPSTPLYAGICSPDCVSISRLFMTHGMTLGLPSAKCESSSSSFIFFRGTSGIEGETILSCKCVNECSSGIYLDEKNTCSLTEDHCYTIIKQCKGKRFKKIFDVGCTWTQWKDLLHKAKVHVRGSLLPPVVYYIIGPGQYKRYVPLEALADIKVVRTKETKYTLSQVWSGGMGLDGDDINTSLQEMVDPYITIPKNNYQFIHNGCNTGIYCYGEEALLYTKEVSELVMGDKTSVFYQNYLKLQCTESDILIENTFSVVDSVKICCNLLCSRVDLHETKNVFSRSDLFSKDGNDEGKTKYCVIDQAFFTEAYEIFIGRRNSMLPTNLTAICPNPVVKGDHSAHYIIIIIPIVLFVTCTCLLCAVISNSFCSACCCEMCLQVMPFLRPKKKGKEKENPKQDCDYLDDMDEAQELVLVEVPSPCRLSDHDIPVIVERITNTNTEMAGNTKLSNSEPTVSPLSGGAIELTTNQCTQRVSVSANNMMQF